MYHRFFSQYKWDKPTVDKCPLWLRYQLDAIIKEAKENLDYFIDLDEYKLYKTLLRLNGVKQKDIEDAKNAVDRSAANAAGGVKSEIIERNDTKKNRK